MAPNNSSAHTPLFRWLSGPASSSSSSSASLLPRHVGDGAGADAPFARGTGQAIAECVSDDALIHLKSYKYSAVDKSPISHYILRPYVRPAVYLKCLEATVPSGLTTPLPSPAPCRSSRDTLHTYLEDAWLIALKIQWNAFVELLPLWLAPNMVTVLGFMCILFNVGVLVVMMPDLEGPVR